MTFIEKAVWMILGAICSHFIVVLCKVINRINTQKEYRLFKIEYTASELGSDLKRIEKFYSKEILEIKDRCGKLEREIDNHGR